MLVWWWNRRSIARFADRLLAVVVCVHIFNIPIARGADRFWQFDADGSLTSAANWVGGLPSTADSAVFDLESSAGYTANLEVNSWRIDQLRVVNDRVVFDLNGNTFLVGASGSGGSYVPVLPITNATVIAGVAGATSNVTVIDGDLYSPEIRLAPVATSHAIMTFGDPSGVASTTRVGMSGAASESAIYFAESGRADVIVYGSTLVRAKTVSLAALSGGVADVVVGSDSNVDSALSTLQAFEDFYVGGGVGGAGGVADLKVRHNGIVAADNRLTLYDGGTLTLDGGTVQVTEFLDAGGRFDWVRGRVTYGHYNSRDNHLSPGTALGDVVVLSEGRELLFRNEMYVDPGVTVKVDGGSLIARQVFLGGEFEWISGAIDLYEANLVTGTNDLLLDPQGNLDVTSGKSLGVRWSTIADGTSATVVGGAFHSSDPSQIHGDFYAASAELTMEYLSGGNRFNIDGQNGHTATFVVEKSVVDLANNQWHIGVDGTALAHISDTSLSPLRLTLGVNEGSVGELRIERGGSVTYDTLIVGLSGHGTLAQDDTSINRTSQTVLTDVFIGQEATASGHYALTNGSNLNANELNVGYRGAGTMTQSASTVDAFRVYVGRFATAEGYYRLDSGSIKTEYLNVGGQASAEFVQNDGHIAVGQKLSLGNNQHSDSDAFARFTMIAGSISIYDDGATTIDTANLTRNAHMVQTGGSFANYGTLRIGNAYEPSGARWEISGGTLFSYNLIIDHGELVQTGGTIRTVGSYGVGVGLANTGVATRYELSGGVVEASHLFTGQYGTFLQTGGRAESDSAVAFGGEGSFTIADGFFEADEFVARNIYSTGPAPTVVEQTGGVMRLGLYELWADTTHLMTGGELRIYRGMIHEGALDLDNRSLQIFVEEGAYLNLSAGQLLNMQNATIVTAADTIVSLPEDVMVGVDIGAIIGDGVVHQAGQILAISSLMSVNFSGTLKGDIDNGGILSPGSSPGDLTVTGGYNQSGTLHIELSGDATDRLIVAGDAVLSGDLIVTLLDDFYPSVGERFTIVEADSVAGQFNNAPEYISFRNGRLAVEYLDDRVVLSDFRLVPVSSDVPAPSSLALLILTSIAANGRRPARRRSAGLAGGMFRRVSIKVN